MQYPPNVKLQRYSDAIVEPITLADAKTHLRVEIPDDDDYIASLITAARMECENLCDRSFITTTWRLTMDYFPGSWGMWPVLPNFAFGPVADRNYWLDLSRNSIRFPYPPLIAVTECTYIDASGTLQALDLSSVSIVAGTPGQMAPRYGRIFPLTQPTLGAVNITFDAGFGADASLVPANIKHAIRLLVGHYYRWRDEDVEAPRSVQRLLDASAWGAYS